MSSPATHHFSAQKSCAANSATAIRANQRRTGEEPDGDSQRRWVGDDVPPFSLTAAATSLFDKKKAGVYQRLLSAPVRRTHILWSKYLFGMLLSGAALHTLPGRTSPFRHQHHEQLLQSPPDMPRRFHRLHRLRMVLAAVSPTSAAANHPDDERDWGRLVSDQLYAGVHPAPEQAYDRLLVDRRLPPGTLGGLHYA